MSSRCRNACAAVGLCVALAASHAGHARELRVCADPDNLPYSQRDETGFENRIATLVAQDMGATLQYTWLPYRRGFVRKTLNAGLCDVIVGVPRDMDLVRTTAPYYRSAYVFVYRAGEAFRGFDDARLAAARIGVQLVGNDLAATPPGHVLAARGYVNNVVGYTVSGERGQSQRMIEAVAERAIDVALVWGPQAGYFARRQHVPLQLVAAQAPADSALPFEFSISMGVRKRDVTLKEALDDVIRRRQGEIDAILDEYDVPRVPFTLSRAVAVKP